VAGAGPEGRRRQSLDQHVDHGRAARATVRGLGLRRRNHSVELPDTPAVRGMINRVSYLIEVSEGGLKPL
jgi:ribosomal protein L30